jgi:uncharacterized SAM-binding protein YcdF (DUF218 family)
LKSNGPSRRTLPPRSLAIVSMVGVLLALLLGCIPLRLAIAAYKAPFPEAVLVLGGGEEREQAAAKLAQFDSSLQVWVSSGIPVAQAQEIFQNADISEERIYIDRRAVDTVTNFTSLVEDLKVHHIQHVYLVTSDFHMPRAKAIATLVLGSQGITFTPVPVSSNQPPEPWLQILRDSSRAFLWIVTGRTGASLNPRVQAYAPRSIHAGSLFSRCSSLETDSVVLVG